MVVLPAKFSPSRVVSPSGIFVAGSLLSVLWPLLTPVLARRSSRTAAPDGGATEPGAQASRDLAHGNSSGIPERVPWIVAQFVNPNGSARPAHIDWIVLGRRRHRKKVCPNQFVALAASGPSPIGRGSAQECQAPDALYFDPGHIADLFTRSAGLLCGPY